MHCPAPATVISVIALFFALSGTAVAATGGEFILGNSNATISLSSLKNTKGSALSLTSKSGSPPLEVSTAASSRAMETSLPATRLWTRAPPRRSSL